VYWLRFPHRFTRDFTHCQGPRGVQYRGHKAWRCRPARDACPGKGHAAARAAGHAGQRGLRFQWACLSPPTALANSAWRPSPPPGMAECHVSFCLQRDLFSESALSIDALCQQFHSCHTTACLSPATLSITVTCQVQHAVEHELHKPKFMHATRRVSWGLTLPHVVSVGCDTTWRRDMTHS